MKQHNFIFTSIPLLIMTRTNGSSQQDDDASGMTRQDAGRLGGETTRERYGSEHFREIGRQGGKARGDHQ